MPALKSSLLVAAAMAFTFAASPALAKNNLDKTEKQWLKDDKKAFQEQQREEKKAEPKPPSDEFKDQQKAEKQEFKACEKNARQSGNYAPGQCPPSPGGAG